MTKIDLFSTTCFEFKTNSFGIKDKEPAVTVPIENGTAKVDNPYAWSVYFIPLDKNLINYNPLSKKEESQCDALLICVRPQKKYDFYFVELKEANKTLSWIAGGGAQLNATILNFKTNYNLSCLSKKIAFLANKSHPSYHYKHTELMEQFKTETGFRLNICATIPIK